MDGRDHRHTGIIDGIPVVNLEVEIERVAEALVCLVRRPVGNGCLTFAADEVSRQVLSVPGIVDTSLLLRRSKGCGGMRDLKAASQRISEATCAHGLIQGKSPEREFTLLIIPVSGKMHQNLRRQNAEN